ncbi:MAG: tRNA uridine-5-carboxymethylaminomethyl(34) synthesis GTPase MnmE [Lachnospiraceae bacterium]|nr:tRNA uridine-5-carboxymethylaminomethyl(34) synthesis GTPase MnmE [Lachnospiraceae bacterium]
MKTDTIAAIATAFSESGIGIIRISGEDALKITDKIFFCKKDFNEWSSKKNRKEIKAKKFSLESVKTYTLHYGFIVDGDSVIDEVLVSVMKAPKSYTAEDVAEINCHGGILILQKVMELLIKNGARVAEPGEFTKRAFLNGRMDLSEAEAVMDLIQSKNEFALQASVGQLKGSVSAVIKELRREIIYEIAFIESALDDPENYNTDGYDRKLSCILEKIGGKIKNLIDHADDGRILKEGIQTVILGKPNAGKSSFLNELLGEEKAIVTNIAGTTRDVLEETIKLGGISLHIMDTAGIRKTEDTVEKIGVEKAKKYAQKADLIVYIVDSSVDLDESDEEILDILKGKYFIVLLNKSDLDISVTEKEIMDKLQNLYDDSFGVYDKMQVDPVSDFDEGSMRHEVNHVNKQNMISSDRISASHKSSCVDRYSIIKISALKHQGIDEFERVVKRMFFQGDVSFNSEVIITSMRHKEALQEAEESISMVQKSIEAGMSEDFYSVDLMNAYAALGKIIGEEVGDDLVNEIFEKFCMGK